MTRAPIPADPDVLLALVRVARQVLDAMPKEAKEQSLPPKVQRALNAFYNLTDYHGIAPADAPHITDDGMI